MAVMIMFLVHKPSHTSLAPVVIVHIEKVMAIVQLCGSAQRFRALVMILHDYKALSMISIMLSQCPISHVFLRHPRSCILSFFGNPCNHVLLLVDPVE